MTNDELERREIQSFNKWLEQENPAIYHLAYHWDEAEDEVIHSAKASVLDMRTAWMARAKQESNDAQLSISISTPDSVIDEKFKQHFATGEEK
ncbi:hypothetical protein [Pantoea sp. CCBC3-3-1]|uniref:hypothetical protein n=1 Tax=Pantoea sp. CCBC3-3-1 TaxID=2490851 RepID=UPI0011BD6199|nr:hypothetical protein [Pantoea sp. CCBC3-3-1]